jgi:hypothetical protein
MVNNVNTFNMFFLSACKYSVSDVAKLLNVERKLIKDWAYHFSDYLNSKANPPKGIEREFTTDDLCTVIS